MISKNTHNKYQKAFIKQRDQSDCGVACLASIIKFFDSEVSIEKLRELSGTSKEGTTLLGLFQTANQLGLKAEGFEAEIKLVLWPELFLWK